MVPIHQSFTPPAISDVPSIGQLSILRNFLKYNSLSHNYITLESQFGVSSDRQILGIALEKSAYSGTMPRIFGIHVFNYTKTRSLL